MKSCLPRFAAPMADDADTLKTLKAELSAAKTDPENFAERASAVSSSAIEVLRGAAAATAPSLPVAVHAMRVLKVASDAHSVADASAAVQTFVDGALLPRLGCAAGAEAAQLQQRRRPSTGASPTAPSPPSPPRSARTHAWPVQKDSSNSELSFISNQVSR